MPNYELSPCEDELTKISKQIETGDISLSSLEVVLGFKMDKPTQIINSISRRFEIINLDSTQNFSSVLHCKQAPASLFDEYQQPDSIVLKDIKLSRFGLLAILSWISQYDKHHFDQTLLRQMVAKTQEAIKREHFTDEEIRRLRTRYQIQQHSLATATLLKPLNNKVGHNYLRNPPAVLAGAIYKGITNSVNLQQVRKKLKIDELDKPIILDYFNADFLTEINQVYGAVNYFLQKSEDLHMVSCTQSIDFAGALAQKGYQNLKQTNKLKYSLQTDFQILRMRDDELITQMNAVYNL